MPHQLKALCLIFFFLTVFFLPSYTKNAVLLADSSSSDEIRQKIQDMISEYIQAVIYRFLLETTGEIIKNFVQRQQISLMPQFYYLSVQKTVVQLFEQDYPQGIIRETYQAILDEAMSRHDEGVVSSEIQSYIDTQIESDLREIFKHEAFPKVVQYILQHVFQEQQMMIAQQVIQARVQQLAYQHAVMQQVIRQRIEAMAQEIQKKIIQRAIFQTAQKHAIQQQMAREIVKQRYEQAIQAYREAIEEQYQRAVQEAILKKYHQ